MAPKALDSRHAVDSCTLKLQSWRPFNHHQQQSLTVTPSKTLDSPSTSSSAPNNPWPYHYSAAGGRAVVTKRPCLSDRATAAAAFPIDSVDFSRLSLIDDGINNGADRRAYGGGGGAGAGGRRSLRLMARKRRRRGSRSVSGRSSDRSGTRRCCSIGASAAYGTCSDFPVPVGTDSSGELFLSNNGGAGACGGGGGDGNWSSDMSEAKNSRNLRRERVGEKESLGGPVVGGFDPQAVDSGYGSEPGYRGDAEFGGDELDEEEDDGRLLFWGDRIQDIDSTMEIVGENSFSDQKTHHRCRRKKHDIRMVDSVR